MKIAVDTNVLVRYLLLDDPVQSELATREIEAADTVVLSISVLCEAVWVLRRGYKLPGRDVAATMRALVQSRSVESDRPAAEAGLRMLEGGGDFADGVILLDAERAKATTLVTFDRAFARQVDPGRVRLLAPAG